MLLNGKSNLSKNHIIFRANNTHYFSNLDGDDRLNVFNRNLMNIYLERFEDTIGRVDYNSIIQISTNENRDDTITDLPIFLEGLTIINSTCRRIRFNDSCKQHLEYIFINKTNLQEIPNIDRCDKLKSFKVNFSNITEFNINYDFPPSLMEFSLANNMITNNNFSIQVLKKVIESNRYIKISFSDNHLKKLESFPDIIVRKCNFTRQGSYKHQLVTFRNVGNEEIIDFIGNRLNVALPGDTIPQILNSTQTVHLTSINKSVIKSFEEINKFIINNNIPIVDLNFFVKTINSGLFGIGQHLNKLRSLFFASNEPSNEKILFGHFLNDDYELIKFLEDQFEIPTRHAATEKTYYETFKMVYSIFAHLVEKNNDFDIFDRLKIELKDSKGYCWTGCYNRLINSLVGIVDGVTVGISSSEELQLEFGRIIDRLQKAGVDNKTFLKAMTEACETIQNTTAENGKQWIVALSDMAPDPEEVIIDNKIYYVDWDNFVISEASFALKDYEIIGQYEDNKVVLF